MFVFPFLICNINGIYKKNKELYFFFLITIIFSIINIPFSNSGLGGTINFVVCFTMAFYLLKNPIIASNFTIFYCIYIIGFLWFHLVVGEEDAYTLYEENLGLSRNFPGFLLVAATSLWCFTKKETQNSLPLLVPILALILVFMINGRSSMGAVTALFFICVGLRGKSKLSLIIISFVIISALIYFYKDIEEILMMSRLAEEGADNHARDNIWKAYVSNLDFISLFLGVDTDTIPLIHSYDGNPHNAFLNYHRRMGLFPLLFLLYFCIKAIKWFIRKKSFVFAAVLLVYLFRIFFDSCSNSTFDFILYYILFFPYIKNDNSLSPKDLSIYKKRFVSRLLFYFKVVA